MPPYDPHSADYAKTGVPFDQLAALRREAPVSQTPAGSWYLSRRDDIEALFKDVDTFQGDMTVGTGLDGVETVDEEWLFLPEVTEPAHRPIRKIFNASIGAHATKAIAPSVRNICERLVDAFDCTDIVDLHEAYMVPIPGLVMAEIMGLPEEVAGNFMRWASDGTILSRPGCPHFPQGPEIDIWFGEVVRQQRADGPSSKMIEQFLNADVNGLPLTDNQIVAQLHTMVMAGVHTTRSLLTHVVQRLLLDPAMFHRLQADRALVPVLVEESLRHDSPAQRVTRRCLADVEVAGVHMKKGDMVEVGIASANRDEAYYEDSESFRLDRPRPKAHLAFGAGGHICAGAELARLEASTAVETLLDRVVEMRAVAGHDYPPIPGSFSFASIPAVITMK